MLIRPAIDLYHGTCVRLHQGAYDRMTVYRGGPADHAARYLAAGLGSLHVVDLEGARVGAPRHLEEIRTICALAGARAQAGGGVRTREDLVHLLECGVERVILGSLTVAEPETAADWVREFGAPRLVAAMDVRRGFLAVKGWEEQTTVPTSEYLGRMSGCGFTTFLCTVIERDGSLEGPEVEGYRRMIDEFPGCRFIASGGVASLDDLRRLADAGVPEVVVGKAIYENRIRVRELSSLARELAG